MDISHELVPIEKCKKCWELHDSNLDVLIVCAHNRRVKITRYWSPITGEYLND